MLYPKVHLYKIEALQEKSAMLTSSKRIRIPENLYHRYKVICAELDLSIPKQSAELVRQFVEIQEENKKRHCVIEVRNRK